MNDAAIIRTLLLLRTAEELKELAEERDLARSGPKAQLVERIATFYGNDPDRMIRKEWFVRDWCELIEEKTGVRPRETVAAIREWAAAQTPQRVAPVAPSSDAPERIATTDLAPPRSLHDYQLEGVRALDRLTPGQGGILALPTGGGKTKTAVWWMLERMARQGGRILWLAGRGELLDQAAATVREHAALLRSRTQAFTLRLIEGGASAQLDGDILIASVQTLVARELTARELDRAGHIDVVVFDEAHHASATTYRRFLSEHLGLKNRVLVGLTATPTRTSAAERPAFWRLFPQGVVHHVPYLQLMRRGVLARPNHVLVPHEGPPVTITEEHARYIQDKHDLPRDVLHGMVGDESRLERIVREIERRKAELRPMLVFAIDRPDAGRIKDRLRRSMRVEYVDGETSQKERDRVIGALRDQHLDAVVNVGVLTEGTDVPGLRGVVIARPTMSESLYRQMVGRGSRGPAVPGGKAEFTVLDFEQNFTRFTEMLAYRFALEAELPAAAKASPVPRSTSRQPGVPESVNNAVRVFIGELFSAWGTLPDTIEMKLVGWWTWMDGEFTEYLLVFERDRELIAWAVENLRQRVTGLPDAETASAAATFLWNDKLTQSAVSLRKFEALGRALQGGAGALFFDHSPRPADVLELHREAQHEASPTAWLAQQYDDNPLWALEFITRETFVATVLAAGERAGNHDTVEGMSAFQIPKPGRSS